MQPSTAAFGCTFLKRKCSLRLHFCAPLRLSPESFFHLGSLGRARGVEQTPEGPGSPSPFGKYRISSIALCLLLVIAALSTGLAFGFTNLGTEKVENQLEGSITPAPMPASPPVNGKPTTSGGLTPGAPTVGRTLSPTKFGETRAPTISPAPTQSPTSAPVPRPTAPAPVPSLLGLRRAL